MKPSSSVHTDIWIDARKKRSNWPQKKPTHRRPISIQRLRSHTSPPTRGTVAGWLAFPTRDATHTTPQYNPRASLDLTPHRCSPFRRPHHRAPPPPPWPPSPPPPPSLGRPPPSPTRFAPLPSTSLVSVFPTQAVRDANPLALACWCLSQNELAAAAVAPSQQQLQRRVSGRRARSGRVRAVATPARAPRAPSSTGSVRLLDPG